MITAGSGKILKIFVEFIKEWAKPRSRQYI